MEHGTDRAGKFKTTRTDLKKVKKIAMLVAIAKDRRGSKEMRESGSLCRIVLSLYVYGFLPLPKAPWQGPFYGAACCIDPSLYAE
jgi:hypothetical protein